MSTTTTENVNAGLDDEHDERATELIALARMIIYTRGMANDLNLEVGAYCLDLSLQSVYKELGNAEIEGLPPAAERLAQIARKNH